MAVLLGLIWLNTLSFPAPAGPTLDPSWQSTAVFAHREGLQLGRDLIFTYGPLGWLNSYFYPPGPITSKLVWELAGKALLVGALYGVSKRLNRPDRWLFLASALLFMPLFPDTLFTSAITLALITWAFRAESRWWTAAGTLLGVALLAQIKFTYTLLALAGVIIMLTSLGLQHRLRRAAMLGAVFVSAYLASWVLAGQSLSGLPEYWRQSWAISQAYPWAMSLSPQRPWTLACGLAVACITLLLLLRIGVGHPQKNIAWPVLALAAGSLFLSWKHGFTRADGHVLAFFLASMLVGFALPGLLDFRPLWRWHWLLPALCLAGLHDQRILVNAPRILTDRIANHAHMLASLPGLANAFKPARADSPLARALGDGSVDVYNYEQGVVFANGLNYRPRPITQSYSAYTPALLGKNLDFLRSPQSADYLLIKIQSIDNRPPMMDDSLGLVEIPQRYSHVADIDDYAVFKKRAGQNPEDPLRNAEQLLRRTVTLGEPIRLPAEPSHAVWLTVKAPPSLLGKLRSALYQPPELHIVITEDDGRELRRRLIVPMAEAGFVVQPLIESNAAYVEFTQGTCINSVETIRFEPRGPGEAMYWGKMEVTLSALPGYPLKKPAPALLLDGAPFNLRPVRIASKIPSERFPLDGKSAIQLHAPGEMHFTLPPEIRTLRASFGLRAGSYEQGKTDGVTFEVALLATDQQERILFRRHLDPLSVQNDRGTQTLELPIDGSPAPRTVVLRTLPGPHDDTKWDWSYWTQVRFLP